MHKNAATLLDATARVGSSGPFATTASRSASRLSTGTRLTPSPWAERPPPALNDLSLIFKDAPHFERFREQAPPVHEFRAFEQPTLDGCVPMPEEVKELMKGIGARF